MIEAIDERLARVRDTARRVTNFKHAQPWQASPDANWRLLITACPVCKMAAWWLCPADRHNQVKALDRVCTTGGGGDVTRSIQAVLVYGGLPRTATELPGDIRKQGAHWEAYHV